MDTKPFWQSKTLLGVALLLLPDALGFVGFHVSPESAMAIRAIAAGIATYGRIEASSGIGLK